MWRVRHLAECVAVRGLRTNPIPALAAAVVGLVALAACQPVPVTPTAPGTDRVVVFGDSIPAWVIRDGSSAVDKAAYTLIDGTLIACDGIKGDPPGRSVTGQVVPTSAECDKGWNGLYPPKMTIHADVTVIQAGVHAMLDHQLDGRWISSCTTTWRSFYQADIEARVRYLETVSDKVVVVLPARPGAMSGWIMPSDSQHRATCVRSAMRKAAAATGAATVDFDAYLCPGGVCNEYRATDGIHIDKPYAPTVLAWLLDQVDPAPPPAT